MISGLLASVAAGLLLLRLVSTSCLPESTTCTFALDIRHVLSMYDHKTKVYAYDSKLYASAAGMPPPNGSQPINVDNVVTLDGIQEAKLVVAVNGTVPGPTLDVFEGQEVVVHVHNHLHVEAVTIHWHGMYQRGSPWMDGVSRVTQCAIAPGNSFTYKFTAQPAGTHWYHSHIGGQRVDGLNGALIVRKREQAATMTNDRVLMLSDWDHNLNSAHAYLAMVQGHWPSFSGASTQDGGLFSKYYSHAGLFNGRGRFFDAGTDSYNSAPLTIVPVAEGGQYRLRIVNSGALYPYEVSVDNHTITLVASDGHELQPVQVDSVVITAGERFDIVFQADQPVGNYWIRAESFYVEEPINKHHALAILRYEGALLEDPPLDPAEDPPRNCSEAAPCKVANCPWAQYPRFDYTDCLLFARDLKSAVTHNDTLPGPESGETDSFVNHFLNFAFPGTSSTPGSVNGRALTTLPDGPPLTQPQQDSLNACMPEDDPECGVDKVCHCPLTLSLEAGKVVQMVFMNMGSGKGWAHPIHMHGHSFSVIKVGMGQYGTDGVQTGDNLDVDCLGTKPQDSWDGRPFCNAARWKDSAWDASIPDIELANAPLKDTINIPGGGYAMVRFRADNPGLWIMHCHIEVHTEDGMAMLMYEAKDQIPAPPLGFPTCGSFHFDGTAAPEISVGRAQRSPSLFFGVLALMLVIQFD